jgi:hypothetical protein
MLYYTLVTVLILREDAQRFFMNQINGMPQPLFALLSTSYSRMGCGMRPENAIRARSCELQFKENHCENQYAPAMQEQCTSWRVCMTSDPGTVNRMALMGGYASKFVQATLENMTFASLVSEKKSSF